MTHSTCRRPARWLVLTLALGLAPLAVRGQDEPRQPVPPPFTPANDLQFIDAMVPHHQQGVMMADIQLQRGTQAEVRRLARRIKTANMREGRVMRDARLQLAGSREVPPPPDDPSMARDLARLRAAQRAEVDRLFLESMIAHHAGAVQMAHRALPQLQRADMRRLAVQIKDSQARQMGEMEAMKRRL